MVLIRAPTLDPPDAGVSGLRSRWRAGIATEVQQRGRHLMGDRPGRPLRVVVPEPVLHLFDRVGKRQEPVRVEALGLR